MKLCFEWYQYGRCWLSALAGFTLSLGRYSIGTTSAVVFYRYLRSFPHPDDGLDDPLADPASQRSHQHGLQLGRLL